MASLKFKNIFINDCFTVIGPVEKQSKLTKYDIALDDYYFGEKTFEKAEVKMQNVAVDNILLNNQLKNNNIDLIIGGDLINQISVTSYAVRNYSFPFLGIYSACATFAESLIIASLYLNVKKSNVLTVTSSHNLTAERQYRYPVEYGAPKPHSATSTTTGSVSTLLSNKEGKIKVEAATIGKVIDMGVNDVNNFGAAMAPAAADTLYNHLKDLNRDIDYYDLILTGDLGKVGEKIFTEYLKVNYNLKIKKYIDAGADIYFNNQDMYAGGSGPACLPIYLFNKILVNKKIKKILIIATGALHSPIMINQHDTVPAIAHAVSLEVMK